MNPFVSNYKKLEYKGKIIFSKMKMSEFKRFEKYFQAKEACFMFIDEGNLTLRTPERILNFAPKEGLLAKCGNYFFESNSRNAKGEVSIITAYFHPEIIKNIFSEDVFSSIYKSDYDATKVVIDKLLSDFKDNISYLIDNAKVVDDTLLLTKLKELLILLAKQDETHNTMDFVSSLFSPYEYEFKKIITNNVYSSLSLNEFAKLCGMSLATFKRKFISYYEESPRQYINSKKIEKAIQLLSNPQTRISDIAYDCGFDTIKSFNRTFKSKTAQSPSEYRKNNR